MFELTCIIPCFNAARFLPETLDSLARQKRPAEQVILVDDGSTDCSRDIARNTNLPNLRLIEQSNQGPSVARNIGIAAAKTELVSFLDADDLACPNRFRDLTDPFASDPSLEAVFGHWENFWNSEVAWEEETEAARPFKGRKTAPILTTGVFKRSCFAKYGNLAAGSCERADFENLHVQWLQNATASGLTFKKIDSLVLRRRIHRNNFSRKKTNDDLFKMVVGLRKRQRNEAE